MTLFKCITGGVSFLAQIWMAKMLGPWDVVVQEQLEKLVVVGHLMILTQGFAHLPSQKVAIHQNYQSSIANEFWLFKQKENFFRDALWKHRAPTKGLKRPGENPLTSHLHPQNLTLIPKLMGFGTCISAFKYGKHLGICLRLQVGTLGAW